MKMTKIRSGYYVSPDSRYAVMRDTTGYVTIAERDGRGVSAGTDDDGWSLSFDTIGRLSTNQDAGETLGWFDTKRDAVIAAESHNYNAMRPEYITKDEGE